MDSIARPSTTPNIAKSAYQSAGFYEFPGVKPGTHIPADMDLNDPTKDALVTFVDADGVTKELPYKEYLRYINMKRADSGESTETVAPPPPTATPENNYDQGPVFRPQPNVPQRQAPLQQVTAPDAEQAVQPAIVVEVINDLTNEAYAVAGVENVVTDSKSSLLILWHNKNSTIDWPVTEGEAYYTIRVNGATGKYKYFGHELTDIHNSSLVGYLFMVAAE